MCRSQGTAVEEHVSSTSGCSTSTAPIPPPAGTSEAPPPLLPHLPSCQIQEIFLRRSGKGAKGTKAKQLQNMAPKAKCNCKNYFTVKRHPLKKHSRSVRGRWSHCDQPLCLFSLLTEILTFFLSSFLSKAHCCLHCSQEWGGPYFFSEFVQR